MKFVSEDFDASAWENIEPYVNDLLERKLTCSKCIETLISDSSNLAEHISETGALLYIGMTCDTENSEKKDEFLNFVENVRPKLSEFSDKLNRRIIDHSSLEDLPERYNLMIRGIESDIEIFRVENIPLGVEQTKLVTKAQGITGAMTVEFEGKERTFPEMRGFLESNDRTQRKEAWKSMVNRWMENSEELSEIFDELIKIRHQIALNAGFKSYTDYMFRAMHRFDYSVEDCLIFHKSIEEICMPIVKKINSERKSSFGLNKLSPWDVNEKSGSGPDIAGKLPLRPFETVDEMVTKLSQLFHNMSNDLGAKFDKLVEMDTLDLETRKGKAPGGYQYYLEKSRIPFIFMNAAGLQGDLETMIHESGHAFHSLYCGHLELIDERDYPIEFAEVASMSMELLTQPGWSIFYEEQEDADRAKISHLEGVIFLLPWIATIDAFQHWIYANPEHTREERKLQWISLRERFGSVMDWEGNEDFRELSWQQQGHLFGVPFYYVEYGIAQLGALQLWQTHRKNPKKALKDYSNAMELGNTKTLPDLFAAAELELGFDAEHLNSLIGEVEIAMSEIKN
ncbi:MAG: M3 family oligoendopeptidase [Candidatus Thalassarchaeum sp.]|nr:M3 family oligoendopeptidase [Candidatus Thalassarchaeum sp.]MDA7556123.1 M3 family oligoendopeptidase [Euryarchaeota archaeon]MDB4865128.1 M3 family oligoendopeptidase [Euryarchaeota archaeon]